MGRGGAMKGEIKLRLRDRRFYWDPFVRSLSGTMKHVYGLLCDDCDWAGFIEPDIEMMCILVDGKFTLEDVKKHLAGRVVILPSGRWWLRKFIPFHFPYGVSETNNYCKAVNRSIDLYTDDLGPELLAEIKQQASYKRNIETPKYGKSASKRSVSTPAPEPAPDYQSEHTEDIEAALSAPSGSDPVPQPSPRPEPASPAPTATASVVVEQRPRLKLTNRPPPDQRQAPPAPPAPPKVYRYGESHAGFNPRVMPTQDQALMEAKERKMSSVGTLDWWRENNERGWVDKDGKPVANWVNYMIGAGIPVLRCALPHYLRPPAEGVKNGIEWMERTIHPDERHWYRPGKALSKAPVREDYTEEDGEPEEQEAKFKEAMRMWQEALDQDKRYEDALRREGYRPNGEVIKGGPADNGGTNGKGDEKV